MTAAAKKVFDVMGLGQWEKVKDLITSTHWTPGDLERMLGVPNLSNQKYLLVF
jgi:hypothetical protein